MALNRFEFIGNVAQEIEVRGTEENRVAHIRVAVSNYKGNKENNTDFFTVTAFGNLAKNCINYLKVGREVFISGHIAPDTYTNKDGVKISKIDLIAENIEFLRGGFVSADKDN